MNQKLKVLTDVEIIDEHNDVFIAAGYSFQACGSGGGFDRDCVSIMDE